MQAIVTYPEKKEEVQALKAFLKALKIKFELKEETYNSEFVEKINKASKNYKKGEYITIKDEKNKWESILSE